MKKWKSNFRNYLAPLSNVHSVECDSYAAIYHETSFLIIQSVLRGTHANKTGRKKKKRLFMAIQVEYIYLWDTYRTKKWITVEVKKNPVIHIPPFYFYIFPSTVGI